MEQKGFLAAVSWVLLHAATAYRADKDPKAAALELARFFEHEWRAVWEHEPNWEQARIPPHCLVDTPETAWAPGVEPLPGELVLPKRRYSAFFGTDLAIRLYEHDVKRLIITGLKTNVCVRATVQDAFAYGFTVVVPREAVTSNRLHLHEASLEDIERYFGHVVGLDEALAMMGTVAPGVEI